ncbi:uncharacterized protein LOC129583725 [Paramacrobiotus metropolitanus]|uniref:uncharacterized protein LOC129583725 n=1 Tax=Paramacrobiotus metropolitanus TaxID=2943436 RepID=UPI002445D8D9|nr:uncharacterized protein LOC129583725 [Paramacrobiotus metropolitanus]
MNQKKVTGEEMPTGKGVEPVGASQLDATISGTHEQDKNVNLAQVEERNTKVTEEGLTELGLDDLSLNEKAADDDLFATPMVSDESNESYFTDDDATMNMSFQTAMKEADRAEEVTPFKDIPEHLIDRTQNGKVINVRPQSPNSPTLTLRRRVRELENELDATERQADKRKQEYRDRLSTLETRLFELEQQQGDLQSSADGWKVKYERQKEIAEEYLKMADDREMEGHLAVSDLNESMSEESAERSRHLAELKDECDQLRQKVTEAETKRDEYATKFAEVTQRLTTLATETFKLRNDLKLREEAVSTLQLESKGHQERADEAEKSRNEAIKAMREARDITATEGARLKEEIKKVNQENEKVTEDIEKVTKEGLKWQKEARRLDTMVTTLELKDKEWQQQVAQKSQEIAKLNTDLVEMTTTALAKDDELIAIKDQLRSAAGQYQQLENETSELVEHIKKMEQENEKVTQQESFKLHEHLRKVNLENSDLKREREELRLRTKRLEDENKALQTGNVKAEQDGEKVKDDKDKEPPSGYSHSSRGEPSQFPPHIEVNAFIDEGRRDRPPSRQERPRKSRYAKQRRNQNDDESSEEEDNLRGGFALAKALDSMARKTPLMTFDGSRDTVNGWTRLVKETQDTYQLTDKQIMIEIATAVKGPAKGWFEGEKDIASEDGIEYTVKEWMEKFKDEYGDRDEEVLGLREAYARKFELGKESLDQYYQAMMRFKAKRIITEKQAVGFLIEGCKGDNELYKALRIQKCKTPTDVKDFFRHWATGDEKYKAPKGQRNQEYVTIRQGQVENVPQQRMAAAPAQQQMDFRAETPVREVTERVTFIDGQTGQPITYAMVAAIQAAAQMCQYCMYGNHQTQGCKFANTPPEQNPNLFAFNEWQRLRGMGGSGKLPKSTRKRE